MRALKEIPLNEIFSGMKVIGAHGGYGYVMGIFFKGVHAKEDSVAIKWWCNGSPVEIAHSRLDKVFEIE